MLDTEKLFDTVHCNCKSLYSEIEGLFTHDVFLARIHYYQRQVYRCANDDDVNNGQNG